MDGQEHDQSSKDGAQRNPDHRLGFSHRELPIAGHHGQPDQLSQAAVGTGKPTMDSGLSHEYGDEDGSKAKKNKGLAHREYLPGHVLIHSQGNTRRDSRTHGGW